MENVFFSIVVFILIALLLAVLVLLFVTTRQKLALNKEKLPRCQRTELLSQKERTMLQDLRSVSEKNGMEVHAKVSLGALLKPVSGSKDGDEWSVLLKAIVVDFVVCDTETGNARLVVLQGESESHVRGEQVDLIERACEKADIPTLHVRDYNLPGLEKAMAQKWARPVKRPGARPVQEEAATAAQQ